MMRELLLTASGLVTWSEADDSVLQTPTTLWCAPLVAATCDFDHPLVGERVPRPRADLARGQRAGPPDYLTR